MSDIVIPPPREGALRRNPQTLVLVGPAQIGKTCAVAALPDTLLLELQVGGADYVPRCWAMTREKDFPDIPAFLRLLDYLGAQRLAGKPIARRVVVDYLGLLDDWIFEVALLNFLASPRGKGYAEKHADEPLRTITDLKGPDPTSSPGWGWYREELMMMHRRVLMAAPEIVYIAHPRLSRVTKTTGDVYVEDIDVSGTKARRLFAGESSAIGFCRREQRDGEDRFIVSFKSGELATQASRCPHLSGQEFIVGRSKPGQPPVFSWDKIYVEDFPQPQPNKP